MLIDRHIFDFTASVPWPIQSGQLDWVQGLITLENWLETAVGKHYTVWAWNDSGNPRSIGVAFKWERDRSLFLLSWS